MYRTIIPFSPFAASTAFIILPSSGAVVIPFVLPTLQPLLAARASIAKTNSVQRYDSTPNAVAIFTLLASQVTYLYSEGAKYIELLFHTTLLDRIWSLKYLLGHMYSAPYSSRREPS